ncbi:MAG TPA: ABC transporter permease [Acidimicrobiales bacterium]|nr:ABC transporter permease [Acidimicrobiales bacterium]
MVYLEAALLGLFAGGAYALIGVAVTLMFRSTGVLSFAHAAFAAVGAYLYVDFVDRGWEKPLAALAAVVLATVYGLVIERVVIRPLRFADATTRLIATTGVLTLTSGLLLYQYGFSPISAPLLLPDESFELIDVSVSYQQAAVLVVALVAVVVLAAFLYRTRFGTAVRAVAQDADAARLCGVPPQRVARFNWALGAFLAAVTGVLVAPLQNLTVGTFTLLLAKALAGTLLGGLASMLLSFVGGLAVGVLEAVTVVRFSDPGSQELAVLAFVVVLLFARRRWPTVPQAAVAAVRRHRPPRPAVVRIRSLWDTVAIPVAVAGLVLAVFIPANSTYWAFVGGRALFFTIEALALVLLAGWAGQVSLMQGAYVGIGAFGTGYLIDTHGLSLGAALLVVAVAGALIGAVVGVSALRLSGLQFGVASLVFSGAAVTWLFNRPELPSLVPRDELLGIDLTSDIAVYFVMLAVTAVLFLLAWNLRRSTYGTLLVASRDEPDTVDHFGNSAARTRMATFVLASFMATLGGGFYAVLVTGLQPQDFSVLLSLSLLVYTVAGGSRSLLGPVLAGVGFGVLPQVFQAEAGTSASAVPDIVAGLLVVGLLAWRPDGLAGLLRVRRPAPQPAVTGEDVRRRLGAVPPPDPARLRDFAVRRPPPWATRSPRPLPGHEVKR